MLKPHRIGIVWYAREDYARALEIMVDSDEMPDTFDEWFVRAIEVERQLQARGFPTVHAALQPDAFVEWCRVAKRLADAEARSAFAAEFAERAEADHRPIRLDLRKA